MDGPVKDARKGPSGGSMALPLLLLLAACGPDPLDVYLKDGPFLRSAATSYALTERAGLLEVSIPYAFENKTGGVLYLEHCPGTIGILPPILERKKGDDWETAWALP